MAITHSDGFDLDRPPNRPTIADLKRRVFFAVHAYPSGIDDIVKEADLHLLEVLVLLVELEEVELIRCHSEEHLEWVLCNA